MAQTWLINPSTGDYELDGGQPKQTDSLKVPAYFRLKAKRGQWMYAPDNQWGSDFYTVTKRPTADGNKVLENIGVAALQPMIEDGRAQEVSVDVVQNTRSASGLQATILDASGELVVETFQGLGR